MMQRAGKGAPGIAEQSVATDWFITRLNVNQGEKSKEWLSGWEKLQLTVQIEIEGLLWVNHDIWNTNQRWTSWSWRGEPGYLRVVTNVSQNNGWFWCNHPRCYLGFLLPRRRVNMDFNMPRLIFYHGISSTPLRVFRMSLLPPDVRGVAIRRMGRIYFKASEQNCRVKGVYVDRFIFWLYINRDLSWLFALCLSQRFSPAGFAFPTHNFGCALMGDIFLDRDLVQNCVSWHVTISWHILWCFS